MSHYNTITKEYAIYNQHNQDGYKILKHISIYLQIEKNFYVIKEIDLWPNDHIPQP